jgi:hypothetical protein
MNRQDPVVTDLVKHINRSAGQHQRRMSEGTASARRLQSLPVQTDEEAANLKAWRASGLRRVDTSQMGQRDGVSVGACRTDLPIEYASPEPREFDTDAPLMTLTELFFIVLIVVAVFGLALKFYMP